MFLLDANKYAANPQGVSGEVLALLDIEPLNFDAVVRLTEALIPLLRASAPSSIVTPRAR